MLKIALVLRRWHVDGRRPSGGKIRSFNHELVKLHDKLVEECKAGPQTDLNHHWQGLVREDLDWMHQDEDCRLFVQALASFAGEGRYYHLNRVLSLPSDGKGAEDIMTKLENHLASKRGIRPPEDFRASLDPYYHQVGTEITALARRYHRALARLFHAGLLGGVGRQFAAGTLWDTVFLTDEQLRAAVESTPLPR
jgi:hypothetical protein